MQVVIDGKIIGLDASAVLGAGGEGTVFKGKVRNNDVAIKVYHQPDQRRARKLQAFLSKNWLLPKNKIALPLELVFDASGNNVVGLTMPLLGKGFEELSSLANKRYRAANLINTKMVSQIFLDGGETLQQVHANGLVIGDFNDLNGLFRGIEMLFIDVDAWQFDQFPCPVGTEQFLAPELYGTDLSMKPVFKPAHDWYSFAVMLCKSLLYTHPYGGIHKGYKQLTARAANRVTVFSPDVIYPKIALSPDLLNDDLADEFDQIFSRGRRGDFSLQVLETYAESLIECPKCGSFYPHIRNQCPVCSEANLIVIMHPTTVTKGVSVYVILQTNGPIVFSKVIGNAVFVIAYEDGKAVLYSKRGNNSVTRQELFKEIPGARYELTEDMLVVNPPHSTELMLVDVKGSKARPVIKTETSIYSGNRRAIFRASNKFLFRIAGGSLMYGVLQNDNLIERQLRTISQEQTWFTVRQEETEDKPSVCGFFQVFREQFWWLIWEGNLYENLRITPLEIEESLLDVSVKFSSQSVLIRRLTQKQGVNYIRTDMINTIGQVLYSSPRIKEDDHAAQSLHGQAYSTGKLLHATDLGILQEDVTNRSTKTFDATKGHVQEGNSLSVYQGGVLVVKDTTVVHLQLS